MSITNQDSKGLITVFTGPMFSGKTTALINEYERLLQLNKTTLVLKPSIDNRYNQDAIVSHNKKNIEALNINDLTDAKDLINTSTHIFIDEAQFLPTDTVDKVLYWQAKGKSFIISGLDTDYLSQPFGIIPDLIRIADKTLFLTGKCDLCNNPSTNTFRKSTNTDLIQIGEKSAYLGLCKRCFLQNTKHYEDIN